MQPHSKLSELENEDLITKYLAYTSGGEVPTFFNRWACIVGLGAWLEQDVWFPFGHGKIYPNVFAMLLGAAGTRKSTAIKQMKELVKQAGYTSFAPKRVSKEKFLEDLAEHGARVSNGGQSTSALVDAVLWSTMNSDIGTTPQWIAADEFNEFFSNNILDFVSMLGDMWDFEGMYEVRTKSSGILNIPNPNVSILGGNTTERFCGTFPPDIIGQGFFSRLIFVYGEPNGVKIAFPEEKNPVDQDFMVGELQKIKSLAQGEIAIRPDAREMLEKIYASGSRVDDSRFESYANRKFTHLLKLVIIHTLADYKNEIEVKHVVRANTVLTHTEHFMPRALGEFGAARNSAVAHKVLKVLESSHEAMDLPEIWKHIPGQLDKIGDLAEIIKNLSMADKIQMTNHGFLAKRKVLREQNRDFFDWDYLTDEERRKK